MNTALDSDFDLESMYPYSPASKSSPALSHQALRLPRYDQYEVSLQHENSDMLLEAITKVSTMLHRINAIAEQWSREERWSFLLTLIFGHWLGGKRLARFPSQAEIFLSG